MIAAFRRRPLRAIDGAVSLLSLAVVLVGVAGFVAYFSADARPLLTAQGPLSLRPDVVDELAVFFGGSLMRDGQITVHLVGSLVFWATGGVVLLRATGGGTRSIGGVTLVVLGAALFSPISLLEGSFDWIAHAIGSLRPGPEVWRSVAGVSVLGFGFFFPDGKSLGRTWDVLLGLTIGHIVLWAVFGGSFLDPREWPGGGAGWTLGLCLLVVAALLTRVFRTPDAERIKIAPVAIAVTATMASIVLFWLLEPRLEEGVFDLVLATPRLSALHDLNLLLLFTASLLLLPFAVAVAVVRYRLWEIDLLVNRALVYTALTAVIAAGFLFGLVGVGSVLASQVDSGRAVAGVTTGVVLVVVFQPVRRRIQRAVDRRFYRDKYDAEQAIADFIRSVPDLVDADAVEAAIADVVRRAVHCTAVWTVVGDDLGLPDVPSPIDRTSGSALISWPDGAEVVVPLVTQGHAVGGVFVGPRMSGSAYTAIDRNLLQQMASAAAPAVRVAVLVEQQERLAVERAVLEREMAVARTIQHDLLPHALPDIEGWAFASVYESAREVGGDYYDVMPMADGRLGLLVADVSGKGVPAAMMMATCRAVIRSLSETASDPAELLGLANRRLAGDIRPGMFVTCFLGVLEPGVGRLVFANAGHTLPALRHPDGRVDDLRATGMPFGWFPDAEYESVTVDLTAGSLVVIPSDGVIEARDASGTFFGVGGFHGVVHECSDPSVVDEILAALRRHCAPSRDLGDDVTMLAFSRV